ncbi:MAG TPA: CapA family protein [Bacteroidales bacterium]|nr:CapA family protein [Bacteroidales bacterium]HQB19290.1 CapA family protein [Bacteroidales bacterium]
MIKKTSFLKTIRLILIFFFAYAQVSGQSPDDSLHPQQDNQIAEKTDDIINFGKTLLGKPYRYVTPDGRILDCAGFVSYIHHQAGFILPRSSASLASISKKINLSEVKKGDLLFFKGRNIQNKQVGHVSMVIAVDSNTIEMMHSCRRGILIEKYQTNEYYTSRFLFAGTLPQVYSQDTQLIDYNEIAVTLTVDSIKTIHYQDSTISKEAQYSIVSNNTCEDKDTTSKSKTVKIIGVGDIMLGTNYPNSSYLPPNDGKDILLPVKEIISKGDVSFGNLEGVLLSGKGDVKKCSNPAICYAFKMPDHYVDYLVDAGFNLLSIANNHIRDFGSTGTANTIRILKESPMHYAGLEECPYATFEKNGIKYGFAAFAPNTGTVKINDYENARRIISYLDSISDIVIVSFHGGAEGSSKKHITRKTEMFLGENRGNPYEFARMAIDAGADVIFGHGPHVTRAIDIYQGRFIAYSLGNFATYGRFNLSGPNGLAPIIELNVNEKGEFISGKIHSTIQLGEGGPMIDEQNRVLKEIQNLTRTDIPECILHIESDGTITFKNKTKR